jgi:prolyl 4-hydroxylase
MAAQSPPPTRRAARATAAALPLLLILILLPQPHPTLAADAEHLRGEIAAHGAGTVDARWESVHLTWKPRAQLLRGFLSEAEADALVAAAAPLMQPSTVVNSTTGEDELSTVRTSTGYFFERGNRDVPVIREIEHRVALATMLPVEHQEGLQILHYRGGQEYKAHHDFFWDEANKVWRGLLFGIVCCV